MGPRDRARPTGPPGYEQFATFQPTFLYEALWNLALAGLLMLHRPRRVLRPGRIFVLYIGGYAVGRFSSSRCAPTTANEILGLRVNIWISLVTFVGVLIFLAIAGLRRRPGDTDEPYYDGHRFDREPEPPSDDRRPDDERRRRRRDDVDATEPTTTPTTRTSTTSRGRRPTATRPSEPDGSAGEQRS